MDHDELFTVVIEALSALIEGSPDKIQLMKSLQDIENEVTNRLIDVEEEVEGESEDADDDEADKKDEKDEEDKA